ncbi:MAG: tyrosine--tRNA ligase [Candidatus Daviesbacteria bacterium]|nr:tyrosine--tRNA ligase [Candidatus Daviesbacteria bacterium]
MNDSSQASHNSLSTEQKMKLITRNLEETLTEEELKALIESGTPLKHYIGFEISGKVHLGQGLLVMQFIKQFQEAGMETTVFLADWHTWLNKKLDGTLETARRLGRDYFEQALRAAALCVGADPDKIKFVLGSELYEQNGQEYWATVVRVSKATTLARMLRSTTIMGRKEADISDAAMLIYPAMQAADIFIMDLDIIHAGTDQRNVQVIARDVAKDLGKKKPVALHHHLLLGIGKQDPEATEKLKNNPGMSAEERMALMETLKMSKSKPETAVFIDEEPEVIRQKVANAFCPEGEVKLNPILDWCKYLVFFEQGSLTITRPEKYGGNVTYTSYEDLENDFADKKLHPQDLKMAVADWLIEKLKPARDYFEDPKRKEALEEIEKLTSNK